MKPFLLLLLCATAAQAQIVRGTVIDDTTKTPIPLANIVILNDSGRVLTTRTADSTGLFEIPLPRNDSVKLRVEAIGYETVHSARIAADRGELVTVEVRMSPKALPLNPIIVKAHSQAPMRLQEFYERADLNKKLGRGRIWTRADLEKMHVGSVRGLLGTVQMRPSTGCRPGEILLDDLPIDARELDSVFADDLEGIEVYRDPMDVPDRYNGRCWMILLWRKPYGEGGKPLTWKRVAMFAGLAALLFVLVRR